MRGTLRVSAPMVYGSVKVAPLLVALAREQPALDVHLKCEDRLVDLIVERVDVAVRVLSALPAEFVARALTEDRRGLYASPAYLRGARAPTTLDDLASHAVIAYKAAGRARCDAAGSCLPPTAFSQRARRRVEGSGSPSCPTTSRVTTRRPDCCAGFFPARCRRRGKSTHSICHRAICRRRCVRSSMCWCVTPRHVHRDTTPGDASVLLATSLLRRCTKGPPENKQIRSHSGVGWMV